MEQEHGARDNNPDQEVIYTLTSPGKGIAIKRLVIVFPGFCEGGVKEERRKGVKEERSKGGKEESGNAFQTYERYDFSTIPAGTKLVFVDTGDYSNLPHDANDVNYKMNPTRAYGKGLTERLMAQIFKDEHHSGIENITVVGNSLGGLLVEGAIDALSERSEEQTLSVLKSVDVVKYTTAGELKHHEETIKRSLQVNRMLGGMAIEGTKMHLDATIRRLLHSRDKQSKEYMDAKLDQRIMFNIGRTALTAVWRHLWKHPILLSRVLRELPASQGRKVTGNIGKLVVNRVSLCALKDTEFPLADRANEEGSTIRVVKIPGNHGSFAHTVGVRILEHIVSGRELGELEEGIPQPVPALAV